MLDINVNNLLYIKPIKVIDEEMLTDIAKTYKIKEYYIKFNNKIETNFSSRFGQSNIKMSSNLDNFNFFKDKDKQFFDINTKILINNNLCIYKSLSYEDLLYILSYILTTDETELYYDFRYNHNMLLLEDNQELANKQRYKWESNLRIHKEFVKSSKDLTLTTCSISNNDITVKVRTIENLYNTSDLTNSFLNYEQFTLFVIDSAKHFKDSIPIKINITDLSVLLMPTSDISDFPIINITKMFNTIRLQSAKLEHDEINISKTTIHSNDLDSYLGNDRPMYYVRTSSNSNAPFKNINIVGNVYSIYLGKLFDNIYTLNSIDIYKYGGIVFNYYIKQSEETYETISTRLVTKTKEFFNEFMIPFISIKDYVVSPYYNPYQYSFEICNIYGNIIIDNCKYSTLEDIMDIVKYKPNSKINYSTKSSCEMNMMCSDSLFFKHNIQVVIANKNIITKEHIINGYTTVVHSGFTGSSMLINIKNAYNYESFKDHVYLFILAMRHYNKNSSYIKISHGFNVQSIKELKEFAKKYPKENLKQLHKEDPELFGKRLDKNNNKTYSNLCQKPEQRPVIINEETYKALENDEKYSKSVAAIANQTYNNKTIYLMCPDDNFKILNFHNIPNQKCIVRCTTSESNKSQYMFCAAALGMTNVDVTLTELENQMVVRYNPMISVGRKCMLPDELAVLYSNYILISFEKLTSENINVKCMKKFGMKAFVIERVIEPDRQFYRLLSNDVNMNDNYILILTTNIRPNVYFYFVHINNKKLILNIHDHPELQKIFNRTSLKVEAFDIFFKYITNIVPDLKDYNYNVIKNSNTEYFDDLNKIYGIKFVVSNTVNEIVGLVDKNNILYTTPRYIYDNNVVIDINNMKFNIAINRVDNGIYKLPNYKDIISNKNNKISKIYKDQTINKCVMINVNDYDLFIEPCDVPRHLYSVDIITIDFMTILKNIKEYKKYISEHKNKQEIKEVQLKYVDNKVEKNEYYKFYDVITYYTFLCYYSGKTITSDNVTDIIKYYNAYTTSTPHMTYIKASKNNVISWSTAKIDDQILASYFEYYSSGNVTIFIKLISQLIKSEYNFVEFNNETIYSKPITNL